MKNINKVPYQDYDIAITVGVFDCFHYGHDNLIEKMESLGKMNWIFLHNDDSVYQNKRKFPVQPLAQRMMNLYNFVDIITPIIDANPSEELGLFAPMWDGKKVCYIRGDDWRDFPGKKTIEAMGIDIFYVPYTKGISSTEIRKKALCK